MTFGYFRGFFFLLFVIQYKWITKIYILDERSVASAVGSLSTASANKLAQMQVGTSFPHANDILFTQSQAAEFASMGVPVASHHISNAPAWKEQIDSNARGVSNGIMNGRLWQQCFRQRAGLL